MKEIAQQIEAGRAENDRRVSDYRALVALLCSGADVDTGKPTAAVTVLAVIALIAWFAWRVLR